MPMASSRASAQEVAEDLEVLLGLAREADDEVGARAGLGSLGACLLQQAEERLGVPEAPHPPQHRVGGVLEGQVEVGRHPGGARDRGHQPWPGLRRLQVGDPDALDPVHGGELGQHGLQQPQVAEVLAVRRGVLADQEELVGALLGQPACLGQHVGGTTGDERAAEGGDRAERAPAVAPGGELQRGHRAGVQAAAVPVAGLVRRGVDPLGRRDRQQLAAVLRRVRMLLSRLPGSSAAVRRCRGSRRSRGPRRPRAARWPARRRTARPGTRPRRRPWSCSRPRRFP